MDLLSKMGAIGSFLGGIFGTLTFVIVVWPWPQIKARKAAQPIPKLSPIQKLISIPLVLSLLLSAFAIYSAWRPSITPAEWYKQRQSLELVEGKQFVNEQVELDGKQFNDNTFTNVTLVYKGQKPSGMLNNHFRGSLVVKIISGPQSTGADIIHGMVEGCLVSPQCNIKAFYQLDLRPE